MKKIHNCDINNTQYDTDVKVSPFSIFEGERIHRYSVDNPCGIWLTELDKQICIELAKFLVLSSDLLYRLFMNQGQTYEKKDIQNRLQRLGRSGYVQKIGFETDYGYSANKAYILLGRGVGLVNSLGIRCKLGGFLSEQDHVGLKRMLSSNQLLISGRYENASVAQIIFIEPKSEKEKASCLFRPTATCLNAEGEAYQFIESVRRTTTAKADLCDKLERVIKVMKDKTNANIKISKDVSIIIVAEDYRHLCELIKTTEKFRNKLNILFTYDLAVYSSDDFLYEYCPDKRSGFFKEILAACF